MTLSSDVEAGLAELSEHLDTLESDLITGLNTFRTDLAESAVQWEITAVADYGSDRESYFQVSLPVSLIIRWFGDVDFAKNWRPKQWELLSSILPYTTPGALIYSWYETVNPEAAEALAELGRNEMSFRNIREATVHDVNSLIELPRKLGKFYTQWDAARAKMDAVPGRIDDALQLERTGLTWAGPGYESYRAVADRQRAISEAVRSGINDTLADVMGFVGLSMDIVTTLKSAADTLKSGVLKASQDLWAVITNPTNWLGVVKLLANAFIQADQLRRDAALTAAQDLASVIAHSATINTHFSSLRGAAGVSAMADVSWPRPSSDIALSWDPIHRT